MDTLINILLFVLMLGILITFHELGHFLTARLFNVYIFEFAIGMGPKVFQMQGKETKYSLRMLPIGGYVAMMGEQEDTPNDVEITEDMKKRSLKSINRGKKAVIMSAGIIVNLLLGLLIFSISNLATPQTRLLSNFNVATDSAAFNAGLRNDDVLVVNTLELDKGTQVIQTVGTASISSQTDKSFYVLYSPVSFQDLTFSGANLRYIDQTITSVYEDDKVYNLASGDQITFNFSYYDAGDENTIIPVSLALDAVAKGDTFVVEDFGLSLNKETYYNTFGQAMEKTGQDFVNSTSAVVRGLISLFTPKGIQNVSGPVGIFSVVSASLQNFGIGTYLFYWGLISINLGLFNLLPFPGLDGWHLVVTAYEAIARKEINPKVKNIISTVGLVLLLGLSFIILIKDIIVGFF